MKRMPKIRIFGWLALLLLTIISGIAAYFYHEMQPPEIVNGLAWGKAPITERLLQQYPMGTLLLQMTRDLEEQGFVVDRSQNKASKRWSDLVCGYMAEITWRSSADRITEIGGYYHETGCL
jgi:hypothetical protein